MNLDEDSPRPLGALLRPGSIAIVGASADPRSFGGFVLDNLDRDLAPAVEQLGMRTLVTDTMMTSMERKKELASEIVRTAGGRR